MLLVKAGALRLSCMAGAVFGPSCSAYIWTSSLWREMLSSSWASLSARRAPLSASRIEPFTTLACRKVQCEAGFTHACHTSTCVHCTCLWDSTHQCMAVPLEAGLQCQAQHQLLMARMHSESIPVKAITGCQSLHKRGTCRQCHTVLA